MKRAIIYIVTPLAMILIAYLMFAFALWQLDPAEWQKGARAGLSVFSFCCIIFGLWIAKEINEGVDK